MTTNDSTNTINSANPSNNTKAEISATTESSASCVNSASSVNSVSSTNSTSNANSASSPSLDVIILTKNEAKNIQDCLKSFEGSFRAIVIDDDSQDETVALAKALGAEVYYRLLDSFAAQRNFALTKSQADWVFFLDADERFTPELIKSVKSFISQNQVQGQAQAQGQDQVQAQGQTQGQDQVQAQGQAQGQA
ncbi:MAG: glycosyltransferase, partial [Deltaproteobacteria bacterium]|nr:glycosyltransferase [Deltaproteobacteria bacterium]